MFNFLSFIKWGVDFTESSTFRGLVKGTFAVVAFVSILNGHTDYAVALLAAGGALGNFLSTFTKD